MDYICKLHCDPLDPSSFRVHKTLKPKLNPKATFTELHYSSCLSLPYWMARSSPPILHGPASMSSMLSCCSKMRSRSSATARV